MRVRTTTALRLVTAGALLTAELVLLTLVHDRVDATAAAVRPARDALSASTSDATAGGAAAASAGVAAVVAADLEQVAAAPGTGDVVRVARAALASYAVDPEGRRAALAEQLAWSLGSLESRSDAARREGTAATLLLLLAAAGAAGLLLRGAALERRSEEQDALEAELAHRSSHDELTGLPHRESLRGELDAQLADPGNDPAVLVLGLGGFREVNATLGHGYGDSLLRLVAGRLTDVAGAGRVARIGGDEFAVVVPAGSAQVVAAGVRAALAVPFAVDGVGVAPDVSIGIATAGALGDDAVARRADTLLRLADVALHGAREGGSGVAVYDRAADTHSRDRLGTLSQLRRAIEDDGRAGTVLLHLQPQVDLATGRLCGVEALVRWEHPERGLLAPAEFVPAAEGSDLIAPLTLRVLDLALTQAAAWQAAGTPVPVSVNLSPRCLHDPQLPARVASLLARHAVPAHLLCLEVTESSVVRDPRRGLALLEALHDQGVRLSVDDFGTGWSSMATLAAMPLDELKIDQSFVRDLARGGRAEVLTRAVVSLGHDLGLRVIAEGVEDEVTLERLRVLGCDRGQGFLLGRPVPASLVDLDRRAPRRADVLRLPETGPAPPATGLVRVPLPRPVARPLGAPPAAG